MIQAIKQFFSSRITGEEHVSEPGGEKSLQLATAALLLEVSRADLEMSEEERNIMLRGLQSKFELSDEETREIMHLAELEGRNSPSYYEFTSLINSEFPLKSKIRIVELMWHVAFADGVLDKHEEHLIRRVAGLLHVPHEEFINTKLRARKSAS